MPLLTRQDINLVAAMVRMAAGSAMSMEPGITEEGEFYYTLVLPSGDPWVTFAQLGEKRVLFGPSVAAPITWLGGQCPPPAFDQALPRAGQEYRRIVA